MGTATVDTTAVNNAAEAVTQNTTVENTTYVLFVKEVTKEVKGEGGVVSQVTEYEKQFMTESAAEKYLAKPTDKSGKEIPDGKSKAEQEGYAEFARQTFSVPVAQNDAGIAEVVPSEKERVKLFERGKSNKAYQIIRARMLEVDEAGIPVFQPVEGVVSLKSEVAEETASRATTPEAKMEKLLEGVDAATAAALLQKLMARVNQQAQ